MRKIFWVYFICITIVLGYSLGAYTWGSGSTQPAPYKGRFTVLEVNRYVYLDNLDPGLNYHIDAFYDAFYKYGWSLGLYHSNESVILDDIYINLEDSDIVLFSGHGGPGIFWMSPVFPEYDYQKQDVAYAPTDIPFWHGGKKWIIFYSCETLDTATSIGAWKSVFIPSEDSPHAILGATGFLDSANCIMDWFLYYAFGDGVSQKPVWEAWRDGSIARGYDHWVVYFLGGAKSEIITNPIEVYSDYDVWIAYNLVKTGGIIYSTSENIHKPIDGTAVDKEIGNKKIKLNYEKPNKQLMYGFYVAPEIEDFSYFENDFYYKHGGELKGLYDLRKTDLSDKIRYTNGIEDIFYYKNSGAIVYQRNLSDKFLEMGKSEKEKEIKLKNIQKIAEQFINKYGGGLPEEAVLDSVHTTILQNLTRGETKIQSYTLCYSKYQNGIKVTGPTADGIRIEVDADGVAYYRRLWRTIERNPAKIIYEEDILDEEFVLNNNITKVLKRYITPKDAVLEITEVNLVYKGSNFDDPKSNIVLAWEYKMQNGMTFYIDVLTGELLE